MKHNYMTRAPIISVITHAPSDVETVRSLKCAKIYKDIFIDLGKAHRIV